jgi:DNA-directed RNA polymerase subunit A"
LTESHKDYLDKVELPKKLQEELDSVAEKRKLNASQREKLLEAVKKGYLDGNFEPGDVFGIIAAQSISEPATQMTMRTYHFAGSAGIKVTYGLPRLIEIFDAKKKPDTPVMTIFLEKQYNNKDDARKVAEGMIEKSVENASKRISINLSENTIDIEPADARSLDKFVSIIKSKFEGMQVRTRSGMVVVKADTDDVKEMQKLKEKVMEVKVDGLKGITNAVVRREGEDWIINTIGSNLEGILNMKEVDKKKTTTNDINETAKILGIEAARNLIIREALNTLQEQGLDVDIRHIMLVADIMTMTGEIRPIGRYGIAGTKTSILARAAFEETIKHLVKASIMNETDSFNGIFENVMVGQVIPSGTGMFDLVAKFDDEVGVKKDNPVKEEGK